MYYPCITDSELVMDFERMNKDDKKKKKSPKVVSPETEQVSKPLQD